MFVPDFQVLQGVLPIDSPSSTQEVAAQCLGQQATSTNDLSSNAMPRLIIKVWPGDGPHPDPDPR